MRDRNHSWEKIERQSAQTSPESSPRSRVVQANRRSIQAVRATVCGVQAAGGRDHGNAAPAVAETILTALIATEGKHFINVASGALLDCMQEAGPQIIPVAPAPGVADGRSPVELLQRTAYESHHVGVFEPPRVLSRNRNFVFQVLKRRQRIATPRSVQSSVPSI